MRKIRISLVVVLFFLGSCSALQRNADLLSSIKSEPAKAYLECLAYTKASKESPDPRGCDPLQKVSAGWYQFELDKAVYEYCNKISGNRPRFCP